MSNYYPKGTPDQNALINSSLYFYGLNRNDDNGFLTLYKVKTDSAYDSITIQTPAVDAPGNRIYEDFSPGVDFFEGRDLEHNLVYDNLFYEQYKWDSRNIFYYIDEEGNFSARINSVYNYSEGYSDSVSLENLLIIDKDLGSVVETGPLENSLVTDLGAVADTEIPNTIIDCGTLVQI